MLCRSKYPFLKQNTKEITQIITIVKLNVSNFHQVVCALRSLSIMGGIQNLIICVKMAWSEYLDCGVNIR